MGTCGRVCCCVLAAPLTLILAFVVCMIPVTTPHYHWLIGRFLSGPLHNTFMVPAVVAEAIKCAQHMAGPDIPKGCLWNSFGQLMFNQAGGDPPGLGYSFPLHPWMPMYTGHLMRYTHAAVREETYNPSLMRPADIFIQGNLTDLVPMGYVPAKVVPSFLNLQTDDKEHVARRALLADIFVALARNPHKLPKGAWDLRVPDWITPADFEDPKALEATVAYNIYWQLFGLKMSKNNLELINEWGALSTATIGIGIPPKEESGKRVGEINAELTRILSESEVGKKFVAEADARFGAGTGLVRLQEMSIVVLFAGVGGTTVLTAQSLRHTRTNPAELVPMFQKDPAAYMLETARLFPPVAGINPIKLSKDATYTLGSGRTVTEKKGDLTIMWINGANNDPAVFADAAAFRPGRANAERLLTWANELGDVRKCEPSGIGVQTYGWPCKHAPRPCPGTELSLRVATDVVGYFIGGIDAAQNKAGGEL